MRANELRLWFSSMAYALLCLAQARRLLLDDDEHRIAWAAGSLRHYPDPKAGYG